MNINKKNLFFSVFLIFIVAGILFLSAQEPTEIEGISSQDFSYYGENAELIDDSLVCKTGIEKCKIEIRKGDITTTIEATPGIRISPLGKISIAESGASFSLNGNSFENIKSGEIILDINTGKITNADFFTNENLGNYKINGNEFNVPANKRFVYDSKENNFLLPEGAEIKNIAAKTKIQGENLIYKDNLLSGDLNFDEDGNAFVKIGKSAEIDGVLIKNSVPFSYPGSGKGDELMISFDKNDPKLKDYGEYVVLDKEKNYFEYTNQKLGSRTAGKQTIIKFEKENSFYGDIFDSEKDYLGIEAESGARGTLSISRPSKNVLPILEVKEARDISLLQDSSAINFGEHISISQNNIGKLGTVPMRIEFKDKQVVGLIPNDPWKIPGKDAGRYFLWSGKTELVESTFGASGVGGVGQFSSIEEERLKEWIENSEIRIDRAEVIYAMAIDPVFSQSLKDSKSASFFLEGMYGNKEIGLSEVLEDTAGKDNINTIQQLQNNLEQGIIDQNQFANQITNLENQGIKTSISFQELEKEIGAKNAQNLKGQIKKLVNSYHSYYQKTGDPRYLERVMGKDEINALNDCINAGGNFGNCFDKEYKFYGPKTDLCIKNRNYCRIFNAGEIVRRLF